MPPSSNSTSISNTPSQLSSTGLSEDHPGLNPDNENILEVIGKYTVEYELRSGGQARIFVVKDASGTPFVLKKFALEEGTELTKYPIRESYLLNELEHQNIVSMYGMFVDEGSYYIVLEFMPNDLLEHITEYHETMTADSIKTYLKQILLATSHCHSLGVIHRDLKPSNILIDKREKVVKLADFGLARGLITTTQALTPQVVTLNYRAPEIIMGSEHYTGAADIWSVGCIFAEMISGKMLFDGETKTDVLVYIVRKLGYPPENDGLVAPLSDFLLDAIPEFQGLGADFEHVDPAAIDLLMKLLTWDPERRISAAAALEHEYFATPTIMVPTDA